MLSALTHVQYVQGSNKLITAFFLKPKNTIFKTKQNKKKNHVYSWSAAVSPGQLEHKSSSSAEKKIIYSSTNAIKAIKLNPCGCNSYRYRWFHTICSKNGLLSNRMSKFAICRRTEREAHIKYTLLLLWIKHFRILQDAINVSYASIKAVYYTCAECAVLLCWQQVFPPK